MTDIADASLVIAVLEPDDALHRRAISHLGRRRLRVPMSVGIELLLVARKKRIPALSWMVAVDEHFDLTDRDILFTAARALDRGDVPTPFDAVHLADALVHDDRVHTADERLHRTGFPTVAF